MKRILVAIGIAMYALTAGAIGTSQKDLTEQPKYTSSQIKTMARDAHTAVQYTVLANYYWTQELLYKRKAVEQMHLWRERAEMVTPLGEKWPRPVDSARNLHDYYEYRAAQSAALFSKYDRIADTIAAR